MPRCRGPIGSPPFLFLPYPLAPPPPRPHAYLSLCNFPLLSIFPPPPPPPLSLTRAHTDLLCPSLPCSDLGVHVDGYVALVATTIIVGGAAVNPRAADAIMAAKVASDVIIRCLKGGKQSKPPDPSQTIPSLSLSRRSLTRVRLLV